MSKRLGPKLRAWTIAGLLVWLPLVATWLLIKLLFEAVDQTLLLLPAPLRPEGLFGVEIPGLGLLICALIVLGTGAIVANMMGQKLIALGERFLARVPLVSAIYNGVKSLTQAVVSGKGHSFRKVLLIEYPNDGLWTLAFQTADPAKVVREELGEVLTVYVPTTPNPTSGYVIFVAADKVREIDMSVDVALKLIMTLGVVGAENADAAAQRLETALTNH